MPSYFANTVINHYAARFADVRNNWENAKNAVGYVPKTYATGEYSKSKNVYKKPHDFYAYDFEANIPSNAYIKSIRFDVRMRHDGKLDVKAPVGQFEYQDHNIANTAENNKSTGFWNAAYRYAPNKKISKNWDTVSYYISEENKNKYTDLADIINRHEFGLHLVFNDAKTTGNVYISWVRMVVSYELPDLYLTYQGASSNEENPKQILINKQNKITLIAGNNSKADGGSYNINIDLPFGFTIDSYSVSGDTLSFNDSTNVWRVKGKGGAKSKLNLSITPHASGYQQIVAYDTTNHYGYFFVMADHTTGYDEISVVPDGVIRRGEVSCFDFDINTQSPTTTYTVLALLDSNGGMTSSDVVSCELNEGLCSEGIVLEEHSVYNSRGVLITFSIPDELLNTEIDLSFKLCYYPRTEGNLTMNVTTSNNLSLDYDFTVLPAYEKHILLNTNIDTGECTEIINLVHNRIITQVESDLDILPIYVDEYDSDMYVDESTFGLNQWDKKRYIGCVELPYSHYDPKNTTKDKLLDTHYKNKHYLGKENAVDEDITLKIKVPRRKTPTLLGLVGIDRPIPINLVPTAFENDPLNHRGWAEIYGVSVDPTNPLYDTCDVDVKYITHNIISRFKIIVGGAVNDFGLPNVLDVDLATGDEIGEFFDITTDGSYVYDGEDNNTHRNLFSINNGQTILLRSKSVLAGKSEFDLYWDTVLFDENKENEISRVVRLVDENHNPVFEYEYYDFDFSGEVYSCSIMGRVLTEYGYNPLINQSEVYIHSDVEYTSDETDDDYDDEAVDLYGSRTNFKLDGNKLTVYEYGFSGYEFEQEVTLLKGSYYLEVYWKNNNEDADTGNIISYMDFEVSELAYNSSSASEYTNLLVSPYPVPYKKIIFTRQSEEGTIYYLENDGGEFNFLLEPFYQYYCGVDLVAEGSSIFNFNNSYPIIYIQNGLIRFGINRLNGDLYLDKWDYHSKEYIRTNRFRIEKFDDAEVAQINDDIITVNVSDINITMWRGRPYVYLQHEKEDITILDTFTRAYADGIGTSSPLEYPARFDLINNSNLLPECVGGTNLIKSSCVNVTVEDDSNLEDIGDFILYPDKTECYSGEDVICTLRGDFDDGEVSFVVNDDVIATNVGNTITTTLDSVGENKIYAIYHGTDIKKYEISNILVINVSEGKQEDDDKIYSLTTTNGSKFKYNQGYFEYLLTCDGEPVEGMTIVVTAPHQTWTTQTDVNGKIRPSNNLNDAGTYTIPARAYDNNVKIANPCYKKVTIEESTPIISGSTLNVKKGNKAGFRITDESGNPLSGVSLDIDIGGTKYVRKTSVASNTVAGGYVGIKMTKEGTYTAKVKYAGEKKHYKAVSKSFTVVVS